MVTAEQEQRRPIVRGIVNRPALVSTLIIAGSLALAVPGLRMMEGPDRTRVIGFSLLIVMVLWIAQSGRTVLWGRGRARWIHAAITGLSMIGIGIVAGFVLPAMGTGGGRVMPSVGADPAIIGVGFHALLLISIGLALSPQVDVSDVPSPLLLLVAGVLLVLGILGFAGYATVREDLLGPAGFVGAILAALLTNRAMRGSLPGVLQPRRFSRDQAAEMLLYLLPVLLWASVCLGLGLVVSDLWLGAATTGVPHSARHPLEIANLGWLAGILPGLGAVLVLPGVRWLGNLSGAGNSQASGIAKTAHALSRGPIGVQEQIRLVRRLRRSVSVTTLYAIAVLLIFGALFAVAARFFPLGFVSAFVVVAAISTMIAFRSLRAGIVIMAASAGSAAIAGWNLDSAPATVWCVALAVLLAGVFPALTLRDESRRSQFTTDIAERFLVHEIGPGLTECGLLLGIVAMASLAGMIPVAAAGPAAITIVVTWFLSILASQIVIDRYARY